MCLAQLDRAFGYGPKGRGFESSSTRYKRRCILHLLLIYFNSIAKSYNTMVLSPFTTLATSVCLHHSQPLQHLYAFHHPQPLQISFQHFSQSINMNWLRKVGIHTGIEGILLVLFKCVSGHGYDRNVCQLRIR